MITTKLEKDLPNEREVVRGRAKTYVLIRLVIDCLLLVVFLLESADAGYFPTPWIFIADIAGLLLFWWGLPRWPGFSSYFNLIFTASLLIAFDFSRGEITFVPWLLLILLSLAGGLIVLRIGFNSLVALSILVIFGAYIGQISLGRIPLELTIPSSLLLQLSAAVAVVILILNGIVESLVIYLYQNQETLLQTRAQLLHTLTELERRQYELANIQQQTRRTERLSAVGQIAGQISQSLRTPLAALNEALNQPSETLCTPENIAKLSAQVAQALRMTDGLEHFASLGRLHIQTVNVDDLLAEELTHVSIPEDVSLFIDQPPVFPPIQADPDQIRLLLHHLLDNAFQAVGADGVVKIGLKPVAEGVRLTVEDSGPGIPPEQLELIFEPLYTTQEHGFGLGLAICQRVAQLHGGNITVESKVGEGSKFTVYLPRMPRQTPERLAQDAAG